MTGSGTFDTTVRTVTAGGSFTLFDADGSAISRGTWTATAFGSFDSQGGLSDGLQGGVLKITITLLPKSGSPVTGVAMSVTCPFESGAFDEDDDGTTVGDFTKVTGGLTVFHLLQP
jgi:hypothetical protein